MELRTRTITVTVKLFQRSDS